MAKIDKLRSPGFSLRAKRRARLCALLSIVAAALGLLVVTSRGGQADPATTPRPAAQLTAAVVAASDAEQQGHAADGGGAVAATTGTQQQQLHSAAAAADSSSSSSTGGSSSSGSSSGGDSGGGQGTGTGVWFEVEQGEGKPPAKLELLDEPVAEDCYMEPHADYDGPALTWGLTYKKSSAAQCCQACKEFQPQPDGQRCNVWVFCGSRTGECWSPDIWNHTTGECWLKYQAEWDNVVDRERTNLAVNRRGRYPDEFRNEHKTSPDKVQWTAGVIPASG
ncbi:hypothetical protein C2E21_4332 [Chlorella sorokiniana]|uniref:Uncharacterized protein n=1 Tax=Chlorella sorokiniana TaxID=3076 RepID=A0A2P6TSF7_CHLSO|nr:hypothetical protein C2E21_4332 [Chlorella sorokiniana]|eukprot:PRW57001.1 hypothetical protein C2E21_4332 [Chlorella sorokiniana]